MRFKYRAKKGLDEIIEGEIDAQTQEEVIFKLSEKGLFPIKIESEGSSLSKIESKRSIFYPYFRKRITSKTFLYLLRN